MPTWGGGDRPHGSRGVLAGRVGEGLFPSLPPTPGVRWHRTVGAMAAGKIHVIACMLHACPTNATSYMHVL